MKILLAGLGNIGARYLQGILTINQVTGIDIIEPISTAFERGMKICNDEHSTVRRVGYKDLEQKYDIAIVSTPSSIRPRVVESISKSTNIEFWILEKILAQSILDLDNIEKEVSGSKGGWVNTPRRRTSLYRRLKSVMAPGVPFKFNVFFENIGLGCNAIHFIDLVSWLAGSPVKEIKIETEGWKASKRDGYLDFDGHLVAKFNDGSVLNINSCGDTTKRITIKQSNTNYIVNEENGFISDGSFVEGRIQLQSELTAPLITEVIQGSIGSGLPTLKESVHQHKILFSAISSSTNLKKQIENGIPIT